MNMPLVERIVDIKSVIFDHKGFLANIPRSVKNKKPGEKPGFENTHRK